MRKLLISTLTGIYVVCAWGQISGTKNIPVSVVVPQQVTDLSATQLNRLGNKLLNIASQSGLSGSGNTAAGFILYPSVTVADESVVEGGMRNINVVNTEISFIIKHLESDNVFGAYELQLRGSGKSKQQAIDNAISKISVKNSDFKRFVEKVRTDIMAYYIENCNNILLTAQSLYQQQEYDAAIAMLYSIPDAAPCYQQALQEINLSYTAYQKQHCNETLQRAQAMYAGHQYQDALAELYDLEVFDTTCTNEAKQLMTTIEAKLTALELREWNLKVERMKAKDAITMRGIEAVQTVATAFFNRRITSNNFSLIKF